MLYKRKIAIVDDNVLFRKALAVIVGMYAGEFIVSMTASNGKDLLGALEELAPTDFPHIIITDLDMPIMNGYATANHIHKHYPAIKVIAISMRGDEGSIIKMISFGVAGYLQKTLEPGELPVALQAVVNNQYYFSRNHHLNQKEQGSGSFLVKLPSENNISGIWDSLENHEKELVTLFCSPMAEAEIARKSKVPLQKLEAIKQGLFQRLNVNDRITLALLAKRNELFQYSNCD